MHTFLIAAMSLDGFIAEKTDQVSTSWTSKADKQFFSERTRKAGVVVMGSSTYQTIGRPLPGRVNIVYSKKSLAVDITELKAGEVGYTQLSPPELIETLRESGHQEVAICGGASIYSQFLQAGLIDTLYLTVEPVLFGTGVKLFSSQVKHILQLMKVEKMGEQSVLLEYTIAKNA